MKNKQSRNEKIYEMRISGKSYPEIAKKFSLSRERTKQIFLKIERQKKSRILKEEALGERRLAAVRNLSELVVLEAQERDKSPSRIHIYYPFRISK